MLLGLGSLIFSCPDPSYLLLCDEQVHREEASLLITYSKAEDQCEYECGARKLVSWRWLLFSYSYGLSGKRL